MRNRGVKNLNSTYGMNWLHNQHSCELWLVATVFTIHPSNGAQNKDPDIFLKAKQAKRVEYS